MNYEAQLVETLMQINQQLSTISKLLAEAIAQDTWHVVSDTDNMNEIINCACCGRQITFGKSYRSLEIRTKDGVGYAVCEDCHEKEILRDYEKKEKGD